MKIKNILSMKYKKHKVELPEDALLSWKDYKFNTGFMLESGKDEVNNTIKEYVIVKMYIDD